MARQLHPIAAALIASGLIINSVPGIASPRSVTLSSLGLGCRDAIIRYGPELKAGIIGPEIYMDKGEDLSVGWRSSSGIFFSSKEREGAAGREILNSCPNLAIIVYSGPTGGSERWYIRRNRFTIRHSKDSGFPGDESKYWKWDSVPFNYDPRLSY